MPVATGVEVGSAVAPGAVHAAALVVAMSRATVPATDLRMSILPWRPGGRITATRAKTAHSDRLETMIGTWNPPSWLWSNQCTPWDSRLNVSS